MSRFLFTPDSVRNAAPQAKRVYYHDSEDRGFRLSVTPTGAKTFYFVGRVNRRPQRIPVGGFPETTVDQARNSIRLIKTAIAEGRDPREAVAVARRRSTPVSTLDDFWSVFLEDHVSARRSNPGATEADYKRYFGPLGELPIGDVSSEKVRAWHRDLGQKHGEPTANRQVNLLRAMFFKAMLWRRPDGRPYAQSNPAAAQLVPRFDEDERDRFLQDYEAPAFFKALAEHEVAGARHFFQLALWTGARKRNLMQMRFEDINTTAWIWTIPRESFKGQRKRKHPHPVPLISQAREIIELRRATYGGEWVFPGRRRNGKPIGNVNYWWNELRETGGVPDMTIHDLRRTIASWMAMTRAGTNIIAQFLGHSMPGSTKIYARLDVETVRDAVQVAADKLLEVAGE